MTGMCNYLEYIRSLIGRKCILSVDLKGETLVVTTTVGYKKKDGKIELNSFSREYLRKEMAKLPNGGGLTLDYVQRARRHFEKIDTELPEVSNSDKVKSEEPAPKRILLP